MVVAVSVAASHQSWYSHRPWLVSVAAPVVASVLTPVLGQWGGPGKLWLCRGEAGQGAHPNCFAMPRLTRAGGMATRAHRTSVAERGDRSVF